MPGPSDVGDPKRPARAITVRSLTVSLAVIFVSGVVTQLAGVFDDANPLIGTEALPVPALLVFFPVIAVCAMVAALARVRILSKPELVCVLFSALIATAIMSVGFWRYQLSGLSTVIRRGDWPKFQALPDELWPHGENLLGPSAFGDPRLSSATPGARVAGGLATLENHAPGDSSAVRVRLKLGPEPRLQHAGQVAVAVPGRPYLLTALVSATGLGADSSYYIRLYADSAATHASEPVTGRTEAKPKPMLPDGAERVGFYPVILPEQAQQTVDIEFGLEGTGKAVFREPALHDALAIETAYKGFRRVTAAEYAKLPLAARQGVIVVPDSLWTVAGVRYLLGLQYPIADWLVPVASLALFALLVFGATFGLTLLYRKQWLESERYALPMARVISTLLGADAESGGLGERFYRNRWLLMGFGASFLWCALKVLYGYVPSLPDLGVNVPLKSYLADAFWGQTWNSVNFQVLALFVGLGLLLELNILLSLVVGFLLYRMQHWFGFAHGMAQDAEFPYFQQQMMGAYLAYTLLILVFTRRYLAGALRAAFTRSKDSGEARIQRAGVVLILVAVLGFAGWGAWLDIGLAGAALMAAHVVMLAFVAAKFRAECGLPYAGFNHPLGGPGNYNAPLEAMLVVPFLGGMAFFGGASILTMSLLTAVVMPYAFFVVPGLQVEALEIGRRFGVRAAHVGFIALFGICAAVVVGGWIYFNSMYGFGAVNFPFADDFNDRSGAFRVFNAQYAANQSELGGGAIPINEKQLTGLGFGAAIATVVTILRQLFPGFWFHPVGVLAGPSNMMSVIWGSLLTAFLVRWSVLRLGGAATVREKLVPIAIGIFLGAVVAHGLHVVGNSYWFFFNKGSVRFRGLL